MWRHATGASCCRNPPRHGSRRSGTACAISASSSCSNGISSRTGSSRRCCCPGVWFGLGASTRRPAAVSRERHRACASLRRRIATRSTDGARFPHTGRLQRELRPVVEDQRYVVTFDVVDPWYDGTLATNPEGLAAGDFPWGLGYIGGAVQEGDRCALSAAVPRNRADHGRRVGEHPDLSPFGRQVGDSLTLYRAEFIAPRSGEFFIFVNDAMIPLHGSPMGPV